MKELLTRRNLLVGSGSAFFLTGMGALAQDVYEPFKDSTATQPTTTTARTTTTTQEQVASAQEVSTTEQTTTEEPTTEQTTEQTTTEQTTTEETTTEETTTQETTTQEATTTEQTTEESTTTTEATTEPTTTTEPTPETPTTTESTTTSSEPDYETVYKQRMEQQGITVDSVTTRGAATTVVYRTAETDIVEGKPPYQMDTVIAVYFGLVDHEGWMSKRLDVTVLNMAGVEIDSFYLTEGTVRRINSSAPSVDDVIWAGVGNLKNADVQQPAFPASLLFRLW